MLHYLRHGHFVLFALILSVTTGHLLYQAWHADLFPDEPAHIATGMQWWQHGSYSYERLHPPLGRIVMAAPLYLSGYRTAEPEDNAQCETSFIQHYLHISQHHKGGYFPSYCFIRPI